MSHFSVAVFSQDMGDVADLLAPFIEQVEPGSPYAEFVRDERADYDETAKAKGYWHNPNAKWDWYEIGGRWRGMLRLLPGRKGYRAPLDEWTKDFVYPENACDAAFVKDCDFSGDSAAYAKALRRCCEPFPKRADCRSLSRPPTRRTTPCSGWTLPRRTSGICSPVTPPTAT